MSKEKLEEQLKAVISKMVTMLPDEKGFEDARVKLVEIKWLDMESGECEEHEVNCELVMMDDGSWEVEEIRNY